MALETTAGGILGLFGGILIKEAVGKFRDAAAGNGKNLGGKIKEGRKSCI